MDIVIFILVILQNVFGIDLAVLESSENQYTTLFEVRLRTFSSINAHQNQVRHNVCLNFGIHKLIVSFSLSYTLWSIIHKKLCNSYKKY